MAERSVLLGWLDGPNMDLITPALALSSDNYSRLAGTPAGALLRARAAMEQDPEAGARGRQALQRATLLALAEAAADTDMEQASFRQRMANERKTVGEQREPIAAYLERARHGLTANASNPASTGFALIAIAGERIVGSCPDGACMGLDRTASLNAASRWSDETRRLMYAWHVIALKRAVDTLEVSHKTAGFGRSIPMIAEALSGTSGSPIELSLLRYRIKEPTALIQLTQMAGGPPTAAIEETITAVRQLLIDACNAALRERVNVDQATLIHKIGTRAAQPVASPH